jgi:hypothetical protein
MAKYTRHGNDLNKSLKQNVKDANRTKKVYKSMSSSIDVVAKDVYKGKPTKFAGGLTLNKKKKK